MKIKELLYQTPEMTEEKLLEIIEENKSLLWKEWVRGKYSAQDILDEWDLIQVKQSNLTHSQREQITGFVSYCLLKMVKNDDKHTSV